MTEQEWREEFAHRLRRMYKRRGYNQKRFAEALGVSEMTISNYQKCKRTPDAAMLTNMATVLNCSVDDLIPIGEIVE